MKHLGAKMPFDPHKLRGPQIKYHPHMEVRVVDRFHKNREGREEVIFPVVLLVELLGVEFHYLVGIPDHFRPQEKPKSCLVCSTVNIRSIWEMASTVR